jgi:hypothetical protein
MVIGLWHIKLGSTMKVLFASIILHEMQTFISNNNIVCSSKTISGRIFVKRLTKTLDTILYTMLYKLIGLNWERKVGFSKRPRIALPKRPQNAHVGEGGASAQLLHYQATKEESVDWLFDSLESQVNHNREGAGPKFMLQRHASCCRFDQAHVTHKKAHQAVTLLNSPALAFGDPVMRLTRAAAFAPNNLWLWPEVTPRYSWLLYWTTG